MSTKLELLEEKTVDTLKEMARERNLSGYSRMKKNELIELINSNYKKSEIRAWPELEEEEEETSSEKTTERKEEKYKEINDALSDTLFTLESKFKISEISTEKNSFSAKVDTDKVHDVLSFLKEEGFKHLSDVACVDYIDDEEFELIYHLWSYDSKSRAAIKIRIPRDSNPSVKSITDLWTGAQIHERENHEMFGIKFTGNPNLDPLFLEDWKEIPPLRKDFNAREYVKEKYYGGKYEYGE